MAAHQAPHPWDSPGKNTGVGSVGHREHATPPCPSTTPGIHSDSRPSSQWCHPAISLSVVPFSSGPQSLPASESFPMSQLFAWGGQSRSLLVIYFIHNSVYMSEKAMAPHSSTLAWKIPRTEEPGRLQSMGSRRVGHDWATELNWKYADELNWKYADVQLYWI